jgi:hypothetical protein
MPLAGPDGGHGPNSSRVTTLEDHMKSRFHGPAAERATGVVVPISSSQPI